MSLDASLSSLPQTLPDPKGHWITPEEQLDRLDLSMMTQKLVNELRDKGYIFPDGPLVHESIIEYATRSILRRSGLSDKRIPSLMDLAVEQLLEHAPLPKNLTDWHTSLSRLNVRLEKIPPLPKDIHQIMEGKCPIYGDQVQDDGTYLKVKDTHFLSLIPKEFGTLNQFERGILKPYGEREYGEQENPLQFRYFRDEARQEHADIEFPDTHWVLMTKDVLPGSRNKSWAKQVALVDALRQKSLVDYEIPGSPKHVMLRV